eukprot:1821296-Pyramimonas_sp.AAC.1
MGHGPGPGGMAGHGIRLSRIVSHELTSEIASRIESHGPSVCPHAPGFHGICTDEKLHHGS